LFPLWAIAEKFPIWTETHGSGRSLGAGGIIGLTVLLIIFRKTVFDFIKSKIKINHAPPIVIWLILILVAYTLMFLNKFLYDITTVFWMGFIGCTIGTGLTFVSEHFFGKKEEKKDE
jgi:O-antigen ligase